MNTLITSILAVEQEARKRVESASRRASAQKIEAESQADALIAQAKMHSASLLKARTEAAKVEAEARHTAGMQAIEAENRLYLQNLEPCLPDIARRAALLIAVSVLD